MCVPELLRPPECKSCSPTLSQGRGPGSCVLVYEWGIHEGRHAGLDPKLDRKGLPAHGNRHLFIRAMAFPSKDIFDMPFDRGKLEFSTVTRYLLDSYLYVTHFTDENEQA